VEAPLHELVNEHREDGTIESGAKIEGSFDDLDQFCIHLIKMPMELAWFDLVTSFHREREGFYRMEASVIAPNQQLAVSDLAESGGGPALGWFSEIRWSSKVKGFETNDSRDIGNSARSEDTLY
jgi:hypothetical protein